MKKEEFEKFVCKALEELIQFAELHYNKSIPSLIEFCWSGSAKSIVGKPDIINELVDKIYVSEIEIYPCVDLIIKEVIDDFSVLIEGRIANYSPRPFQKGWSNRPGPFIYGINSSVIASNIDVDSKEFKNKLKELGLLFTPSDGAS